MKNNITAEHVVNLLNEMLVIDKAAITSLVATRVPCCIALADHPTIQVRSKNGEYSVGLLGIINGFFGVDDQGIGPIAAEFNDDVLVGFQVLGITTSDS